LVSLAGDHEGRVAVVCAGLHADRLVAAERRHDVRIVPFRGNWFGLRPRAAELVKGNIYPVPDPRFPFLGVHFTRRVDGSVWVGPNAMLAGGREAYTPWTVNVRDVAAVATFRGSWRMAWRYARPGALELYRSCVRKAYVEEVRRYLPALSLDDLLSGPAGIRAQAVRSDGTLVDDFLLEESARAVHVLNAPTPAATSSLAIGRVLAAKVAERL
jgi:L-2-hydroxyglutarate oxidase LhgO